MSHFDPKDYIHLGLYRVRSDSDYERVKLVTPIEYEQFDSAAAVIRGYERWTDLLTMARKNSDDLLRFLDDVSVDTVRGLAREPEIQEHFLEANRLLQNVLASARMFSEFTEAYLKRKYGDSSSQFLSWKSSASNEFDTVFEYRFLNRLRNYALHLGMPLGGITHSERREMRPERTRYELEITFDVESLLRDYDGWGPVKGELEKRRPRIVLAPSGIEAYLAALVRLHAKGVDVQRPELDPAAQVILALLRPAVSPGAIPAVGMEPPDPLATVFHYEIPPLRALNALGHSL